MCIDLILMDKKKRIVSANVVVCFIIKYYQGKAFLVALENLGCPNCTCKWYSIFKKIHNQVIRNYSTHLCLCIAFYFFEPNDFIRKDIEDMSYLTGIMASHNHAIGCKGAHIHYFFITSLFY